MELLGSTELHVEKYESKYEPYIYSTIRITINSLVHDKRIQRTVGESSLSPA